MTSLPRNHDQLAEHTRQLKIRAARVALTLVDVAPADARRILSYAGEIIDFMTSPAPGPARFADLEALLKTAGRS